MKLHDLAARGDLAGVERALAAGVPVDVRDPESGENPLAAAVQSAFAGRAVVARLLERGADPNAVCGEDGQTPLIFAVRGERAWDVDRLDLATRTWRRAER
ncbi:MAG: ankyrin repeat domain-containing protein [Planctomycetes bacterium]|nr:ankyrin repeat domain-containing protein [Planctomycetota bacterium]